MFNFILFVNALLNIVYVNSCIKIQNSTAYYKNVVTNCHASRSHQYTPLDLSWTKNI